MKWIKYEIYQNTINTGTESNPVYEDILLKKKIAYCEENLAIAKKEAYNGDYTIEEDEDDIEVEPQSIELGGTGAKDAEGARSNLNVYSKEESCTKDTLGLFGLAENNSPNNILEMIGKYWWRRKAVESGYGLFENGIVSQSFSFSSLSERISIYYSDNVEVTSKGIKLVDAQVKYLDEDDYIFGYGYSIEIEGKYFAVSGAEFYECVYSNNGYPVEAGKPDSYSGRMTFRNITKYTPRYYEINGEFEYLSSRNKDTHPVGKDGMFIYEFLGKPFDNARSGARISFGSYVGAGTYGPNEKNKLEFDFEPKLVFVKDHIFIRGYNQWLFFNSNSSWWGIVEWGENSVSWYDTYAAGQLNILHETYHYIALG